MPNKKIMNIAMEILKVMQESFPKDYLDTVFAGLLNPGDVVEMVLFDLIKKAYEQKEEKHSLRYFYEKNGVTEMDAIMRYSRLQSHVMKWRKEEFDRRVKERGNEAVERLSELLPPDMSDMKIKLDGYQITEMNFFELTTMLDSEFTKSFTEKRLIDSKKVSNARFKEIIGQFDKEVDILNQRWLSSEDDIVFSTIAAFTLEWKYPIHYLYAVAKKMEEMGIKEFPDQKERLATFCGDIHYESMLNFGCSTHSRMITVRDRYIELMLSEPYNSSLFVSEQIAFLEGLALVSQLINRMTMNGEPIVEWFTSNTTKKDWASFLLDYDIFVHINDVEKAWTNKSIRYFRECLKLILIP